MACAMDEDEYQTAFKAWMAEFETLMASRPDLEAGSLDEWIMTHGTKLTEPERDAALDLLARWPGWDAADYCRRAERGLFGTAAHFGKLAQGE